jgi:hypothetical protein
MQATGAGVTNFSVDSEGDVGIGVAAPTAALHLKAGVGGASAGTAPLKFTAGTSLTTQEPGAIEFDGTDLTLSTSATGTRKSLTAGQLLNIQTITSGTAYTPTPGTGRIVVELWAGGGAGGGAQNNFGAMGGGGGSGGYAMHYMTGVQNKQYVVQVGAGGTGAVGVNGGNGTATTFNTGAVTVTAYGGSGGRAHAVLSNNLVFRVADGGAGGVVSANASVGGAGVSGRSGFRFGNQNISTGGDGGATSLGGAGAGAVKGANAMPGCLSGVAAVAYTGSGGGGASCGNTQNALRLGGNGAAGRIIVYEYY